MSCLWCPSPLWSHKGWERTKQNVGVRAIIPERACPPVNQQRGHVYIKTSVWGCGGCGGREGVGGLIAIAWRQKCQASLVIRESFEVAMTSLTSTILPWPLTLCNLSMSKQTLSGSWKYKCQVFPHENSCDLDPGDKQGPFVSFSLSFPPLSDLSLPLFLTPLSLHCFSWLSLSSTSLSFFYISPSLCLHCGTQDLSTCL